ncbi:MAG: hypothetical protein WC959_12045 [Kiritimatiellales bacterium]
MSRKTVTAIAALFAMGITAVQAELIIAGWHAGNNISGGVWNADVFAAGIEAQTLQNPGAILKSGNGSNDETYGAEFPDAGKSNGSMGLNPDKYVEFVVENTGTQSYDLIAFRFDAYRAGAAGVPQLVVSVASGDITTGDLATINLPGHGSTPATPDATDFDDFDIMLDSLADYTLAAGESVTFRITGVGGTSNILLDNIAVTGIIPEPAAAGLLVAGIVGLLGIRRSVRR